MLPFELESLVRGADELLSTSTVHVLGGESLARRMIKGRCTMVRTYTLLFDHFQLVLYPSVLIRPRFAHVGGVRVNTSGYETGEDL